MSRIVGNLLVLVATVALCTSVASAESTKQPLVSGEEEYRWNCAACHGGDARGDGPLADALIQKPPDLSQITKQNGGVFPAEVIFETIAGRKDVQGHQSFQMPRYWSRFSQTEGQRGYDPAEVRIKAIVEYLRTIQDQ